MRFTYWFASLAAISVGSIASSQDTTPKKNDDIHLIEARMADGSAVRMSLLQANLEVMTRYGKLSIPVSEIKRIELGFRYPEGAQVKIDEAIGKLGASNFKQRETAAAELAGYKELAYPALKRAVKSADAEVAKRAEEVIKKIEEKVPAERLKLVDNDTVHTLEFSIAGKIEASTLKARSPYFGEIQIQLADIRSIRSLKTAGDVELTVDAKFANHNDWMETDIEIASDDPVEIKSTGTMILRPNGGPGMDATPNGNPNYRDGNYSPGQLLGRIGKSGKTFIVGDRRALGCGSTVKSRSKSLTCGAMSMCRLPLFTA